MEVSNYFVAEMYFVYASVSFLYPLEDLTSFNLIMCAFFSVLSFHVSLNIYLYYTSCYNLFMEGFKVQTGLLYIYCIHRALLVWMLYGFGFAKCEELQFNFVCGHINVLYMIQTKQKQKGLAI